MITETGKRVLFDFFSGARVSWAGAIAIGVHAKQPGPTDSDIEFPVEVAPVNIIVPEQSTQSVITRATFPPLTDSEIYEIGLLSENSTYAFEKIVNFDSAGEQFSGGVPDKLNRRVGSEAVRLAATGSCTYTGQNFSFERYEQRARFSLAYYKPTASSLQIYVRVGQDASNYFNYSLVDNGPAGYKVKHWEKSQFSSVGAPTWSRVSYLNFQAQGAEASLDGFIVRPYRDGSAALLVARDLTETPVHRVRTQNMDVEFRVRFNIG